jgi:hypothetical protein
MKKYGGAAALITVGTKAGPLLVTAFTNILVWAKTANRAIENYSILSSAKKNLRKMVDKKGAEDSENPAVPPPKNTTEPPKTPAVPPPKNTTEPPKTPDVSPTPTPSTKTDAVKAVANHAVKGGIKKNKAFK